jgi:hypothetical protein
MFEKVNPGEALRNAGQAVAGAGQAVVRGANELLKTM